MQSWMNSRFSPVWAEDCVDRGQAEVMSSSVILATDAARWQVLLHPSKFCCQNRCLSAALITPAADGSPPNIARRLLPDSHRMSAEAASAAAPAV